MQELQEAYNFLDVDPSTSDSFIVNKYRSRLDDTGLSMQMQMKQMLQKLGRARGSQILLDAASDSQYTMHVDLTYTDIT